MKKRLAKKNEEILVFKVSLARDPSITRELALAGSQTLYTLAEAIIDSVDFALDHCFGFFSDNEKRFRSERKYELFKDIGEETAPETQSVKKTKISDAFSLDKKLLFLFDYGDNWEFIVEHTGKEAPVPTRKYPFLINKTGRSPEQYSVSAEDN